MVVDQHKGRIRRGREKIHAITRRWDDVARVVAHEAGVLSEGVLSLVNLFDKLAAALLLGTAPQAIHVAPGFAMLVGVHRTRLHEQTRPGRPALRATALAAAAIDEVIFAALHPLDQQQCFRACAAVHDRQRLRSTGGVGEQEITRIRASLAELGHFEQGARFRVCRCLLQSECCAVGRVLHGPGRRVLRRGCHGETCACQPDSAPEKTGAKRLRYKVGMALRAIRGCLENFGSLERRRRWKSRIARRASPYLATRRFAPTRLRSINRAIILPPAVIGSSRRPRPCTGWGLRLRCR